LVQRYLSGSKLRDPDGPA